MIKLPLPTEHDEQVRFIDWMRIKHPKVRVFAVPNGQLRNMLVAKRLKAEGVSPGVPDLFIPKLRLFIEMKRKKGGVVSAHQREWIQYLRECGYHVEICRGADAAIQLVGDLLCR